MTHVDRDALAVMALGEEPGPEEQTHVEHCADCRAVLEHMRRTVHLARELSRDERRPAPPPPRVWDAIANELSASGDLPAGRDVAGDAPARGGAVPDGDPGAEPGAREHTAEVRPLRRDGAHRSRFLLTAAASLLVLALLTAGGLALLREPQPTLVADTTLEPLVEVGPATARLLEGAEGLKLEVVTAGLPPPDGYYELWLIDTEVSRLISLGPLVEGRQYMLPEGLDIAEFPVVDVSLEPFDGDPAHSGNSYLRGVLPLDEA